MLSVIARVKYRHPAKDLMPCHLLSSNNSLHPHAGWARSSEWNAAWLWDQVMRFWSQAWGPTAWALPLIEKEFSISELVRIVSPCY